jgi:hypothetical protein
MQQDDREHRSGIEALVRASFAQKDHEAVKPSNVLLNPRGFHGAKRSFIEFAETFNVDVYPEPVKELPPLAAEFFIALFAPKRRVMVILGDREERFQRDVETVGPKRARLRYWADALRSGGPLLVAKMRDVGIWAIIVRWLS